MEEEEELKEGQVQKGSVFGQLHSSSLSGLPSSIQQIFLLAVSSLHYRPVVRERWP